MAALLAPQTLAKWTQSDEAEVLADPFAADLIDKVSALVCFIGGHDGTKVDADGAIVPEWSLTPTDGQVTPPIDVQMIALQVIKRSYENPGQVIQEGSVGPLGGDRVTDVQALFMDFTESERRTLARYNIDGDPAGDPVAGQIFTVRTSVDTAPMAAAELYATDDQQINLDLSPDPRPWMIPLFNPGDPGGDLSE